MSPHSANLITFLLLIVNSLFLDIFVKKILAYIFMSRELSLETPDGSFMCFRLSLLLTVNYHFFLCSSSTSQGYNTLGNITNNIYITLFLLSSTHNFVLGQFNAHYVKLLKNYNVIDVDSIQS